MPDDGGFNTPQNNERRTMTTPQVHEIPSARRSTYASAPVADRISMRAEDAAQEVFDTLARRGFPYDHAMGEARKVLAELRTVDRMTER